MITSYHDNLGIAIRIRGMVGKFQLVTHSVCIKNKLHSNSTSQHVADRQMLDKSDVWRWKTRKHKATMPGWSVKVTSEVFNNWMLAEDNFADLPHCSGWKEMMNSHDRISFHAYLPPCGRLVPRYTHQDIHVYWHYSEDLRKEKLDRMKGRNGKDQMNCFTFRNAPQPETSDLPSKTWEDNTCMPLMKYLSKWKDQMY